VLHDFHGKHWSGEAPMKFSWQDSINPSQAVTAYCIEQLLGGEQIVGRLRSDRDLIFLARKGVPARAVGHLATSLGGFSVIEKNVLPRRTFKRRLEGHQPLDPIESDRLLRLTRMVAAAQETFGDFGRARLWLERPNRALENEAPLALADTDQGARAVEMLLGRIAHGIAA
jgi:putative toxin-antitoxin system antitoxin component (TIGR02293 family)